MADPFADPLAIDVVRIGIAFGIGALIGMEREQSDSAGTFAGSRTFPLFALLGALAQAYFPAVLPVLLVAVALPLLAAYAGKVLLEGDIGLTTLTAALLTVLLGALAADSPRGAGIAIVVGGLVTVVLSVKDPVHDFAAQIDDRERRASVKFILVVLVIFPLLPDRELDALLGLNPRFVWLMVVLVTGLSFVAYVLGRILGTRRGIAITGILGGFVSSTATTVSMAERASEAPSLYRIAGFATIVASIVMFPRALLEVAVVNPSLLARVAWPLLAMTALGALVAGGIYWRSSSGETVESDVRNPFRLGPALLFGAVFAAVLLVSEAAHAQIGPSGVYATAFLSGLADVDAITLTLSKLAADGAIGADVAARGIVLGAVANTLVKAGLAWLVGTRRLGWLVTAVLGSVSALGLAIAVVI